MNEGNHDGGEDTAGKPAPLGPVSGEPVNDEANESTLLNPASKSKPTLASPSIPSSSHHPPSAGSLSPEQLSPDVTSKLTDGRHPLLASSALHAIVKLMSVRDERKKGILPATFPTFFGRNAMDDSEYTEKLLELAKECMDDGIGIEAFDSIISNDLNRRLKNKFGILFLCATCFFTLASYLVVILNGVYKWNISNTAITGLIIEAPLQFFGLLYIIARNLFPQADNNFKKYKKDKKT